MALACVQGLNHHYEAVVSVENSVIRGKNAHIVALVYVVEELSRNSTNPESIQKFSVWEI